jgi:acyl-CoA thioesterase-1
MRHKRLLAVTACTLAALLHAAFAPSGCSKAVTGVPVGRGDHPVVAIIGDSIESGLGLRPAEAWPVLAAADRGWILKNYAVSGAGFIAQGDDGQDFGAQVDRAIASHANIVLIGASDNDLGRDISVAATAAAQWLHGALPQARIVGFNALSGAVGDDALAPLNAALRNAVTAVGGQWLDLGQPFAGRPGLVQSDGEHPTPAGQQAIAAAVLKRLGD